jgi:hypothetical protein
MGIKHGHVLGEDTPPGDNRIRRFRLDNGARVYLPLALADRLFTYQASRHFYFLERGLLGRTEWLGTIDDLRREVARGGIRQPDLGGFRLPPEPPRTPGWRPLACNDDHIETGARLEELRAIGQRRGMAETQTWLTLNDRLAEMRADGCCLVDRADAQHGRLWCADKAGHPGDHGPACVPCLMVLTMVDWSARSAGSWGPSKARKAESRELFGPNGVQVAGLLDTLQRCNAETWKALLGAHLRAQGESEADRATHGKRVGLLIEEASRRGLSSGAITEQHVREAKRLAEEVARKGGALVSAEPVWSTARPRAQLEAFTAEMLRSFANTAATLMVVRPFLELGDLEELWAPYARVLPLSQLPSD